MSTAYPYEKAKEAPEFFRKPRPHHESEGYDWHAIYVGSACATCVALGTFLIIAAPY